MPSNVINICDDTDATSDLSSSRFSSSATTSSHFNSFNSEKSKYLLLHDKYKYQIIKNESQSDASWWRAYGFPAQLNDKNELKRIIGYVSCFKCMHTQIYHKSSGSRRYKEHADKCYPLLNTTTASSISITSSSASSKQPTLNQMGFNSMTIEYKNDRTIFSLPLIWNDMIQL